MDVFYRRTVSSSTSKTNVAAELEIDSKMFDFSTDMKMGIDNSRSDSKTTIEVNYFGANDENWITGLDMD